MYGKETSINDDDEKETNGFNIVWKREKSGLDMNDMKWNWFWRNWNWFIHVVYMCVYISKLDFFVRAF